MSVQMQSAVRNAIIPALVHRILVERPGLLSNDIFAENAHPIYVWCFGCAKCGRNCLMVGTESTNISTDSKGVKGAGLPWQMELNVLRWNNRMGVRTDFFALCMHTYRRSSAPKPKVHREFTFHVDAEESIERSRFFAPLVQALGTYSFHMDGCVDLSSERAFVATSDKSVAQHTWNVGGAPFEHLSVGMQIMEAVSFMPNVLADLEHSAMRTDKTLQYGVGRFAAFHTVGAAILANSAPGTFDRAIHYVEWKGELSVDDARRMQEPTLHEAFQLMHAWAAHSHALWSTLVVACRFMGRLVLLRSACAFSSPLLRDATLEVLAAACWVYAMYRQRNNNFLCPCVPRPYHRANAVVHRQISGRVHYRRMQSAPASSSAMRYQRLREVHVGVLAHTPCPPLFLRLLMSDLQDTLWGQSDLDFLCSSKPWCHPPFASQTVAANASAFPTWFVTEDEWERTCNVYPALLPNKSNEENDNRGWWNATLDERAQRMFSQPDTKVATKPSALVTWIIGGGPMPEEERRQEGGWQTFTPTTDNDNMSAERTRRGAVRPWNEIGVRHTMNTKRSKE